MVKKKKNQIFFSVALIREKTGGAGIKIRSQSSCGCNVRQRKIISARGSSST